MSEIDCLLLVSFGGPEERSDVMPFLRNVTRGRNVPDERLLEVAEHYYHFGGKSPINDQNRALIQELSKALSKKEIALPLYFGNRNWHPLLRDTLEEMRGDGRKHALALITSAYSSYSGCRQYREDIERAQQAVPEAPRVTPIRRFFNHPGLLGAWVERIETAKQELDVSTPRLVFTAHSIPMASASTCNYESQLRANAQWLANKCGCPNWDLVWQSRSGPPSVPWLEPDICDHLRVLAERGEQGVVIAPLGFLSDHMEVVYDLDLEARELCDQLGLRMARAKTPGTHPRFVEGLVQLVEEYVRGGERLGIGPLPIAPAQCAVDCCPAPRRPRPAP